MPAPVAKHSEPARPIEPTKAIEPTASLRPIAPARFGVDQARHLLLRAGFGAEPDEVARVAELGPVVAVDQLFDFPSSPPGIGRPFRSDLIREWTEDERRQLRRARDRRDEDALAQLRKKRQQMQRADRSQFTDLQTWWLGQLIESPHPLQEKMTLFWHGHFATSYRGVENSYHLFLQNQLFRRHAVGRFDALLHAIVHDPAMLASLNNNQSRKAKPNENLARELMELFSLGVGAYSETDIKEGARALTGYTFAGNSFHFRQRWHDGDTKTILGVRGQLDGDDFVSGILRQPACAQFITTKLYRYFVADVPGDPKSVSGSARRVIDRLASTLRRGRYDLKPMLRELFLSEHFYDGAIIGHRIKSPIELIVGASRTLKLPTPQRMSLLHQMGQMGQRLFLPPSVAGWEGGRTWINTSTLFARQNALAFMIFGNKQRLFHRSGSYDPRDIAARWRGLGTRAFAEALLAHALGPIGAADHPVGSVRLKALLAFLDNVGGELTPDVARGMLALVATMPEYQLC